MFGPVSCFVSSKLNFGHVEVRVTPPPRRVNKFLLRAPLPVGWRVESVEIDGEKVPLVDDDAVDLTGRSKPLTARFIVKSA
jgi:hypothetical protein